MGAVAIFYFFATAFAMAVACCGPDPRAKLCSAYLMGAWAFTNAISMANTPCDKMELFTLPDLGAAAIVYIVFLRWPSRWMAMFLAALSVQVIFQLVDRLRGDGACGSLAAHWANEVMFDLQLVAVCIPTISMLLKKLRRRRRARGRIPPPYPGWQPPDDYRDRAA